MNIIMIMNTIMTTSITMMKNEAVMTMSITMTMTRTAAAMITSTIMTRTAAAAMTTTIMTGIITERNAAAAAVMIIMTIIMRMRCLPAGEYRHPFLTPRMRYPGSWKSWKMKRNTVLCSGLKEWCLRGMKPGYTLIMYPAKAM